MIVKDSIANNLKYNGSKFIKRTFQGKDFTKTDVTKYVKQFQEKYKNKGLTLMVSVNTPFGFRSAKQFNINSSPNLVDNYDWITSDSFVIYGWKGSAKVGHNSTNNCLFECILKEIGYFRLPKNLKTDKALKETLHLEEYDKIPLSRICEIEKLYNINFNITGDFQYSSKNIYQQTINLVCHNEHVEINDEVTKPKDLLKRIPFKKLNLVLVEYHNEKVKCYDGNSIYYLTCEDYYEKSKDFMGEDVYIEYTPFEKFHIVDDYHTYIKEIETLRNLTNGRIDLSRSGYKISKEALKCVHYELRTFTEPEKITSQEQHWLINTFMGGLIFSNPCELSSAYNYDLNSAYPNTLCSEHFSFPIKQGEFKHISSLDNILSYGIYRCNILPSSNEHINKLFRFNSFNYYTHYDINLARHLNLQIELIIDDEANALLYTTKRANGSKHFRHLVYSLYELKPKSKLAKKILNAIWGSLCSRNKIKVTTQKEIDFKNGEYIVDIREFGDNRKITYLKNSKYYKYNYARLGCFLTANVRKQMADCIFPFKEHVYRCHTDSILSDIPLNLSFGDDLGNFKLEKTGSVSINNSINIKWNI